MRNGFAFKGVHSNEMGVTVKTRSRPILPEGKRVTFEPSAADGVIDLSAYNSRGRMLYKERQFDVNMQVSADNVSELQRKLSRLASWLTGTGELSFDDLPEIVWKVSRSALIDYAPESAGKQAILSVSFSAEPFSFAPFNARDGITIGSKIPIGTKIPIGLPGTLTYSVSGDGSIEVYNIGSAPTRPVITINDPLSLYTVSIGGIAITAGINNNNPADTLIIDCEHYSVTAVNSSGLRPTFTGTFPELAAGANEVKISNDLGWSTAKTISVDYLPRFLYGWEVG